MISRALPAAALGLGLLATPSFAGDEGWLTNMDEAMKVAAAEDKLILVDFTGSDWCGWCIMLSNEVFKKDEFKSVAPSHWVLVELDFPRRTSLGEAEKKHNDEWKDKFEVGGFPTIVLCNAEGEEFARTGYRPGGPEPYIEHLDELRAAKDGYDEAMMAAKTVEGLDRARMLDRALSYKGLTVEDRDEFVEEIMAIDAENAAGLKAKYQAIKNDGLLSDVPGIAQQHMRAGEHDKVIEVIEAALEKHPPTATKRAELSHYIITASIMKGDHDTARAMIDEIVADENVEIDARQQIAMAAMQIHVANKDRKGALECFETALAMNPKSDFGMQLESQRPQFMQYLDNVIGD